MGLEQGLEIGYFKPQNLIDFINRRFFEKSEGEVDLEYFEEYSKRVDYPFIDLFCSKGEFVWRPYEDSSYGINFADFKSVVKEDFNEHSRILQNLDIYFNFPDYNSDCFLPTSKISLNTCFNENGFIPLERLDFVSRFSPKITNLMRGAGLEAFVYLIDSEEFLKSLFPNNIFS